MRPGTLADLRLAYINVADKNIERLQRLLSRLDEHPADAEALEKLQKGFEAIGRPALYHGMVEVRRIALQTADECRYVIQFGRVRRDNLDHWAHQLAALHRDLHLGSSATDGRASVSVVGDLLFVTGRRALGLFATIPEIARSSCFLARPVNAAGKVSARHFDVVIVDLDTEGAKECVLSLAHPGGGPRMVGISSQPGAEHPGFEAVLARGADWNDLMALIRSPSGRTPLISRARPAAREVPEEADLRTFPDPHLQELESVADRPLARPPPTPVEDDAPWPPIGRAPRVLVADDDDAVVKMLSYYLGYAGWHVTVARDGQRAAAALATEGFDLALIDLSMPFWSGFQLLEWLGERPHRRPRWVHVLTAQSHAGARERSFALGADDFVAKPIDPIGLAERLREPGRVPCTTYSNG